MIQLFSSIIKNFMNTIVPKKRLAVPEEMPIIKEFLSQLKTEQDVIGFFKSSATSIRTGVISQDGIFRKSIYGYLCKR